MVIVTELASPYVTGGGGSDFENQVSTSFAVLMLAGGVAPCLPPWAIKSIKFQGANAGYETEDCIVFAEDKSGSQRARLLVQVKHGVAVAISDESFAETIASALRDFNNPKIFAKGLDALAMISGPLSAVDVDSTRTMLEWARTRPTAADFFGDLAKAGYAGEGMRKKLEAFRFHLDKANGSALPDDQTWEFLRHFHVLGYDFDKDSSWALSLYCSLIAQFDVTDVSGVWGAVFREVAKFNRTGGILTRDNLPVAVTNFFSKRAPIMAVPVSAPSPAPVGPALGAEELNSVALASLIGEFDEGVSADLEAVERIVEPADD